jgi:hypothetical protein
MGVQVPLEYLSSIPLGISLGVGLPSFSRKDNLLYLKTVYKLNRIIKSIPTAAS